VVRGKEAIWVLMSKASRLSETRKDRIGKYNRMVIGE